MKKNHNKAASLLLTILVMTAFLSIALAVSRLSFNELRLSRDRSKSVIAYYAAESGVECQMYNDRTAEDPENLDICPNICLDPPTNSVCYQLNVSGRTPNRSIKSTGSYQDTIRAIELTY